MIDHPTLVSYADRYATLAHEPLRVTAELAAPLAGYDALHLDGLLAFAVVANATQGAGLPSSAEPYAIPLPLACLWRHPESDLPLWAATDFEPVGATERDVSYWHKRAPRPEYARKGKVGAWNIRTTQGRYKEYRIPLPTQTAAAWQADCLGHRDEVARLLRLLGPHLGKKRSQGMGAVIRWLVAPAANFSLTDDAGRWRRPVPWLFRPEVPADTTYIGWTPPYWLPARQTMCWLPATAPRTL